MVRSAWIACAFGVSMILLVGCTTSRPLMPTPSVYTDKTGNYFEDIPAPLRTPGVDVLFATDRIPEEDESGDLRYGYQRSGSLAFGKVQVNLGHDLTWDELVKLSETANRDRHMEGVVGSSRRTRAIPGDPSAIPDCG